METQQLKQEDTQTREGVSHRVLSWFPCFSCLPSSLERLKEPKNQEEEQVNDNEDLSLGRNKASGHGHGQANQRETRITRQHHEDEKEIQKENTHRKSISSRKSVSNETIKTEVVYRFTVCPAIELCSTFYTFSMSSLKIHRHSRQKVRKAIKWETSSSLWLFLSRRVKKIPPARMRSKNERQGESECESRMKGQTNDSFITTFHASRGRRYKKFVKKTSWQSKKKTWRRQGIKVNILLSPHVMILFFFPLFVTEVFLLFFTRRQSHLCNCHVFFSGIDFRAEDSHSSQKVDQNSHDRKESLDKKSLRRQRSWNAIEMLHKDGQWNLRQNNDKEDSCWSKPFSILNPQAIMRKHA